MVMHGRPLTRQTYIALAGDAPVGSTVEYASMLPSMFPAIRCPRPPMGHNVNEPLAGAQCQERSVPSGRSSRLGSCRDARALADPHEWEMCDGG
jgi:hypothetical protein